MISVENLRQGYRGTTVIENMTLRLEPGITALLGPNGAGKTTLLQTLATVLPPRSGRLEIAGREVTSERKARTARRQIGYLPQNFGYEPNMRVQDFVTFGAWARGVPSSQWKSVVPDTLEYVGLTDRASTRMRSLSGGMRQRAGIAWALVGAPPVVLLDEPTVGLDPQQRIEFREFLTRLTATTVLLSTHLADDVDAICERAIVMTSGKIVFYGPTVEMKLLDTGDQPGHIALERAYMKLLSEASPRHGSVSQDLG